MSFSTSNLLAVLRVKNVDTTVLFKNAPDEYVLNPLDYSVSPAKDFFNISVDEYEKTMIDVKKKIALLNKKIFDTKHKKNKKRESIIRYEKMFNDDSGEEVLYNKNAKK